MSIRGGNLEMWTKDQILNVSANKWNRDLALTKDYLIGDWIDNGDFFEVLVLPDGCSVLVDGHHRQEALREEGRLVNLPEFFPVMIRKADDWEDVKARQDSHMEPKRTPNSRQKLSIAAKRAEVITLDSVQVRRTGITAFKLLGFASGKDRLDRAYQALRDELIELNQWVIDFKPVRDPQGILAAMIATIKTDAAQAKAFWAKYEAEGRNNRNVNMVLDAIDPDGRGETYNAVLFGIATSAFRSWCAQ